jgi:hypothetical protein
MNQKNMINKKMENLSSMEVGEKLSRIKRVNFKKLFFIVILILAIGGTATSIYYFKQYRDLKANPNLEAQKETESLVSALGKLMELPSDETPTVATISDKEKLKEQTFFAKAENGDKLLAYTKAMQAILYRPSTNKIINVAPLIIDQKEIDKQKEPVSVTPTPAGLKIAYYNGTETIGLAGESEKVVKKAYPSYETSAVSNASKKDYKETMVIDLTGKHQAEVSALAQLLGGKVSNLPEGEARPSADVLVISGK